MKIPILLVMLTSISSCKKKADTINDLPVAITNNAVALVENNNRTELYTFNGLLSGKTWKDITNTGYRYSRNGWMQIAMPKNALPVLASTAVSINENIYLIGGYTVNAKGEEKSVPQISRLDTITQQWTIETSMPVPVDDTVALVYANRYVYLVSGWHDIDNVSLVQVYDTKEKKWFNATKYPAPAVFGHAGGIVNNQMLICDGVKVVLKDKKRDFVSSPVCMQGIINSSNPKVIDWKMIEHHSATAYYRMAATGDVAKQRVVFAGGSDNPYNYDGIGYNKIPSKASNLVLEYSLETRQWQTHVNMIEENMDHRALLTDGIWYYAIGGMISEQQVTNKIFKFKLN